MFSYKIKRFKKSKKIKDNLEFIRGVKRTILCINYIKYLILLYCKRRSKNMIYKLFMPLNDYLIQDKGSMVMKIKYKVYRKKLVNLHN